MHHSRLQNLLLLFNILSLAFAQSIAKDNSDQCNCYVVSGHDPGYFQYYRFWDFRKYLTDGITGPPPLITNSQNTGGESITSSVFNTTQFNNDWTMLNGTATGFSGTTVPFVDSFQNIFIGHDNLAGGSYLAMRALRLEDFVSTSELDSNYQTLLHVSLRSRMRVVPLISNTSVSGAYGVSPRLNSIDGLNASHPVAPGVVVGMFTYRNDNQESDLEVLTSDPITNIRYSNQPDTDKQGNAVPGASTNQVTPDGTTWTEYHEQRLDWFDGVSRWYVDGKLALEKTVNVPRQPSGFNLNVWSNGGSWSGNMTVGAQVVAAFEWIELVFNTSKPLNKRRAPSSCAVGCSVDDVQTKGTPMVTFNSTSSRGSNGPQAESKTVAFVFMLALMTTALLSL